jgi:Icc-related predicted phosphoesterase
MLNVPCLYVHGNHDRPEHLSSGQTLHRPGGWVNLDGQTVQVCDTIIGGLEGSMRYRPGVPFQYTEGQMARKAWGLVPTLMMNRVRFGRHLDVLVTHAPPLGIHDGQDLPHRGFQVFLWLMTQFRPKYLLHGHKHTYGREKSLTQFENTQVVNVYPYRVLEW